MPSRTNTLSLLVASLCWQRAAAVASFLKLPAGTTWTSLTFTVTVPTQAVQNNGKWAFQSGFHTLNDQAVFHPVMAPGVPTTPVNAASAASKSWAVGLYNQPVNGVNLGNDQKWPQSLFVQPGQQFTCTLTPTTDKFTQTCTSGGATAVSNIAPSALGLQSGGAVASIFVIEAELDGTSEPNWSFPVVFSSVKLVANQAAGVADTCGGLAKDTQSDYNSAGLIAVEQAKVYGTTCTWDTLALIPAKLMGQRDAIVQADQQAHPRTGGSPAAASSSANTPAPAPVANAGSSSSSSGSSSGSSTGSTTGSSSNASNGNANANSGTTKKGTAGRCSRRMLKRRQSKRRISKY